MHSPKQVPLLLLCLGLLLACSRPSQQPASTVSPASTSTVLPSLTPSPAAATVTPLPRVPTFTLTPYRTPTITPPAPHSYPGPLPPGLTGRLGAGHLNQFAASPDGKHVAVASSVGVYIFNSHSFEQERLILADEVSSIAWSPNGKWIAGGIGEEIYIWEAVTGLQRQVLISGIVTKIRWSPESDGLAALVRATTSGYALRVWNLGNATLLYSLDEAQLSKQNYLGADMDWSSGGRLVITDTEMVRVMEGRTGRTLYQLDYSSRELIVSSVSWSPDGRTLALVSSNIIRLLDSDDGAEKQVYVENTAAIFSGEVAWSQDGQYLAMSRTPLETYGLAVAVWDVRNARWLEDFYGHTYPAGSLVWLDGDTKLASIQWNGTMLIVWDLETKTPVQALRGNGALSNLAWSPDGKTISATDGGHILAWDVSTRQLTSEIEVSADVYMNYAGIWEMALSRDGSRYAVVWGDDGRYLETWDARTGVKADFHIEAEPGIAWSPDGKYLVGGTRFGPVNIWDSRTGSALFGYDLDIRTDGPLYKAGVDWSPDGRTIAALSGGMIHLLDFPSAAKWRPLAGCGDHLLNLVWSPDGNKLAAYSPWDGSVSICDPKAARLLVRLGGPAKQAEFLDIAWSPDGHLLAVSSFGYEMIGSRLGTTEHRIVIWDARTWQLIRDVEGVAPFYSVAFSPDSKTLAIGSSDGTIWLIEP